MPRQQPKQWPLDGWVEIGERCQALRRRLAELTDRLPEIQGLKPADLDAGLRAEEWLDSATTAAEASLTRQHQCARPGRILRGDEARDVGRGAELHRQLQGKKRAMTREEWHGLGRELREALAEVDALVVLIDQATASKDACAGRFRAVARSLGRVRSRLEAIARGQHPDWLELTQCFGGVNTTT